MRILLVLVLLALCRPAFAQGVTAVPDLSRIQRGPGVDVVALVEDRFDDTLAILRAEFPADYRALSERLAEIDKMGGEESALLVAVVKQFTELRRKYAPRLRFAPSAAHAAVVGHLAVLYDTVFKEEGPEVCGRFAQDGSAVLFELGLSNKYAEAVDQQSVFYFDAVVKAIETPEPSEPVRAEDWETVMERIIEAGAPPSFARSIQRGNPNDPDLCPALATLMLTISVLDTPEGARARADFAQNVAGY